MEENKIQPHNPSLNAEADALKKAGKKANPRNWF
jgi:hypothetical protein